MISLTEDDKARILEIVEQTADGLFTREEMAAKIEDICTKRGYPPFEHDTLPGERVKK